jgi:PAS domain S-box-containing protein
MEHEKKFARIKELLQANPRGLTITNISKIINLNRNSVARLMDVLTISGQVEMKPLGPAKVYYLSQRVPISALLNFSSDFILVIDNDQRIIQVNDNMLQFVNAEREAIVGLSIEHFPNPMFVSQALNSRLREVIDGKEVTLETKIQGLDGEYYFYLRMLPTTFEDGSQGTTLLFQDITERKRIEETLRETNWNLRERVKELTCLYTAIKAMQVATLLEDLMPQLVDCLVPAMQFPNITVPVIEIEGTCFAHQRYREGMTHGIHADIYVDDRVSGRLSVYYTEDRPFIIPQEQNMLNALAESIDVWLTSHNN